MKLDEQKRTEIFGRIKEVVLNAVQELNKYEIANRYLPRYNEYPDAFFETFEDDEEYKDKYKEMKRNIPQLQYGLDYYNMKTYDNPIDYKRLFELYDYGGYGIIVNNINGFIDLCEFTKENHDILKALGIKEENKVEHWMAKFIASIVDRIKYSIKIDDEKKESLIDELINKKLNRYFLEELKVKVCIPLSLLIFPKEELKLCDNIYIKKIKKEMQLSRFYSVHFDSDKENNFLQNSAYMIVMEGYYLHNDKIENIVYDCLKYPTGTIDDILAAIRIITGYNTGYSQVLLEPVDWIGDTYTNMIPIYGTTINAFNESLIEENFFQYKYKKITNEQAFKIIETYKLIIDLKCKEKKRRKKLEEEGEEAVKKDIPYNKLLITIKRLNKCMLREDKDDMALDAVIGIETLLCDRNGAISSTISNRMSVISSLISEWEYTPSQVRQATRYMYSLRSKIVHGDLIDESDENITIGKKEIPFNILATEFLRYLIIYMLKNLKYLDSKKIDGMLDNILKNNKKRKR